MSRRVIAAMSVVVAVMLALGTSAALLVRPVAANGCTIQSFGASNGITLSSAPAPSGAAGLSSVETNVVSQTLERNPGASVAEQMTAHLRSAQLPALDNRDLILIRLANVRPRLVADPNSMTEELAIVTCSIWIFDGRDGSFVMGHEELATQH